MHACIDCRPRPARRRAAWPGRGRDACPFFPLRDHAGCSILSNWPEAICWCHLSWATLPLLAPCRAQSPPAGGGASGRGLQRAHPAKAALPGACGRGLSRGAVLLRTVCECAAGGGAARARRSRDAVRRRAHLTGQEPGLWRHALAAAACLEAGPRCLDAATQAPGLASLSPRPGLQNCNERQNWTGTAARQAAVATCTLAVLTAGDMAWCVSQCQMLTAVSSLKGGMLVVDAFIMAKLRLLAQRKC